MLLFYFLIQTTIALAFHKQYIARVKFLFPPYDDCYTFDSDTVLCIVNSDQLFEGFNSGYIIEAWPDTTVSINECQSSQLSIWHLNAINNLRFPPANKYAYDTNQPATTVYVFDTWVDKNHPEFEGRVSNGPAFQPGSQNYHGTHVMGLVLGKMPGVNKNARGVSVQVLDDNGSGSISGIIKGLDWVNRQKKGIINMSLGGSKNGALDTAIRSLLNNGWKIVVAAGNEDADACETSPANVRGIVTVGAYDSNGIITDFSNYGPCVDILMPGRGVLSTYPQGRYAFADGTSMASPIFAGLWSLYPNASYDNILKYSKKGIIRVNKPKTTTLAGKVNTTSRCFTSAKFIQNFEREDYLNPDNN